MAKEKIKINMSLEMFNKLRDLFNNILITATDEQAEEILDALQELATRKIKELKRQGNHDA